MNPAGGSARWVLFHLAAGLAVSLVGVWMWSPQWLIPSTQVVSDRHVPTAHSKDILALAITQSEVVLENTYVRAKFNLTHPHLQSLEGRVSSGGGVWSDWKETLASGGLRLEYGTEADARASKTHTPAKATVLAHTSSLVQIAISFKIDTSSSTSIAETWTLSLANYSRALSVQFTGHVASINTTPHIRRSIFCRALSSYALFEDEFSFVQMAKADPHKQFYHTRRPLRRWYTLGGGTSLEILRDTGHESYIVLENRCTATCDRGTCVNKTEGMPNIQSLFGVLLQSGEEHQHHTALHEVLFGEPPSKQSYWTTEQPAGSATTSGTEHTYNYTWHLYPNNGNFPTSPLATSPLRPLPDLEPPTSHVELSHVAAFLTAIYGTLVGTVHYSDEQLFAAPTVHAPRQGYSGHYNFFDPDTFFITVGLTYSHDPALQAAARRIIETTGEGLREDGLVPHHFSRGYPDYRALSTAHMPGPNFFWLCATLTHAAETGDRVWLRAMAPKIERAFGYLLSLYSEDTGLFYSSGSLMVDTVKREGYTTDFNAAMCLLLPRMAEYYSFAGKHEDSAKCTALREQVSARMNELLWDHTDNDHYITSVRPTVPGTATVGERMDMVDYDANALCIAAGIADKSRAIAYFHRKDTGNFALGRKTVQRPSFVSGIYYNESLCHVENSGDSNVSFGRVFYYEAHSRRRVNDAAQFLKDFEMVVTDLHRWTWLSERYDLNGYPHGHRGFFEYPAVVAMLLREVVYGVHVSLNEIHVRPWVEVAPERWVWGLGQLFIQFSDAHVLIDVPLFGDYRIVVSGLKPGTSYSVMSREKVTNQSTLIESVSSDGSGVVECTVLLTKGSVIDVLANIE